MADKTPLTQQDRKLENEKHLRTHEPSVTKVHCRRKLQNSFNAVENLKDLKDEARSNHREINHQFVYPRCSACSDREPGRLRKFAMSLCNVCNIYLCTSCTKNHRTDLSGHVVTSISPRRDVDQFFHAKNGYQPPVCHEGHKVIPKYFCETCQDVVCLECIETTHKKHQFMYVKDAYGKHKEALEKHIQNAREEADRIVKQLNKEEDMMCDSKTEKDEITKMITSQTEMIMGLIRKRETKLLQDLERIYSHKEDDLTKKKERLNNRLELIRRTCRFTEIAMNDGDEAQVLLLEKYARKRLEELCRAEFLPPNSGEHFHYFVPSGSPEKVKQLLGKVVCSDVQPNQCVAHGEGLRRAVVGQETCFTVDVKGNDGISLTTGGDDVQAQVTTSDNESLQVRVTDNNNGTFNVTYCPTTSGVLNVAVRVYGERIKTPDCKVTAVCQRDYKKIEKPILTISRVILSGSESTLKLPCGVAVTKQGRLLVADCHNHSIKIFTRDGKFIKSFGCFGGKNGQLNNPTDIAVNEDKIYVCDKDNSRVQCFTLEGVFLSKFSRGTGCQLKRPWGLCIDSRGHVVVADTKNNQIQVFSCDGQFVTSFGRKGSGESEFFQPYFVATHFNGQIYITDNGNHRVQVFDESYSYLFQFNGDNDNSRLKYPTGIAIDNQGHVIVADQYNSRLQVYLADGKNKAVISKPLNSSQCPSYPKGVAVTQDGYVVVADSDNDKVLLL